MIGNVPILEDWNTELPRYPLVIPQPFFFTRNRRTGLSILKSQNNTISFEYKMRTKLAEILRMRVLMQDGTYKEIKCNIDYLDVKSDSLQVPELYGRYSDMSPEERNWRKGKENGRDVEAPKFITYIEDVEKIKSKNAIYVGTKEEIPLSGTSPAKHVFWNAARLDSGYSNYTTNRDNVYEGWNPCEISGIKYGNSDRVPESSHEHHDLSEAFDFNWPSSPHEGGYNAWTLTNNPPELIGTDTAALLKECGAVLVVQLGDTNPFLNRDEEGEFYDETGMLIPKEALEDNDLSKRDKYNIHVRIVVIKKLETVWSEKNQSMIYTITST